MTREDAVAIWLEAGQRRVEADLREHMPQKVVDRIMLENAEDTIDGLVALGLITLDLSSGLLNK